MSNIRQLKSTRFTWFTPAQFSVVAIFMMTPSSRLRPLLPARIILCLLLTFASLLVTFGLVLGLVTVPGLRDQHHTSPLSDPSRYAVVKQNFPDPCLIQPDGVGRYYAFATRNDRVNVQVASTPTSNISTWEYHDGYDALPRLGNWTATQLDDVQVWAPSVMQRNNGSFVMYYSALARNHTRRHCIGAAVSETITGPYRALDEPVVCDFLAGGVIDPAYFHDPATNASYLIYKQDGNAIGAGGDCGNGNWPNSPTPLMAAELSPEDLTTFVAAPFELITNLESDGPNIESPVLWYYEYDITNDDGGRELVKTYHIAFNAGCYLDRSYRIEQIICIASAADYPDWDNPGSPRGIRDCKWKRLETGEDTEIRHARTLLESGATKQGWNLMAPGGPGIATSNSGGVGDGTINKQFMVFHADINDEWFVHGDVDFQTQVEKGWDRKRAMFVGELQYVGVDDMIEVIGLLSPAGTGEK